MPLRPTQLGFGDYRAVAKTFVWSPGPCVEQPYPPDLRDQDNPVEVTSSLTVAAPVLNLTATPSSYIPMANGAGSIPGCPVNGAAPSSPNPTYTASLSASDGAGWEGIIQFKLSEISGTTSSTIRNRGYSTNGCFNPTCDAALDNSPDFDFVLADQTSQVFAAPVHPDPVTARMATSNPTASATAVVSSRDFGGVATLSAEVAIDEMTIQAKVGQDSSTSIPLDENGNGIADAWEDSNGGRSIPAGEDLEPGAPGSDNLHKGDGYSRHDEYRGFAVKAGGSLCHVRTDPRNKQDLFFWDQDAKFSGDLDLFRSLMPWIELREVTADLVELASGTSDQLDIHNRNRRGTNTGYSLWLKNFDLGGQCLASPPKYSGTLGHAPDAPPAEGPDGRYIQLDDQMLSACSQLISFPTAVYRQIVVAHEIGHNLSLRHPRNLLGFQSVSYASNFSQLATLQPGKYTYDPSPNAEFFTWLGEYYYPIPNMPDLRPADQVAPKVGVLGSITDIGLGVGYFSDLGPPRRSIYNHRIVDPSNATVSGQTAMVILPTVFNDLSGSLKVNLMNWSPYLDAQYQTTGSYSLRICPATGDCADDPRKICTKATCLF